MPPSVPASIADAEIYQPGFAGRANDRILAYLPSGPDDPLVRYAGTASYEQIAEIVEQLGLQEFQGGILPRNFLRASATHQIDLGGQLSIPAPRGRFIVEGAVENFLNLFDRDRGVIRRFNIREDLYAGYFDPEAGQFVISNIDPGDDLFSIDEQPVSAGSLWRARIGLRYQF